MTHTLHNGDCLGVMRGMENASVNAVITDPPYGITYQSARRIDRAQRFDVIANDEKPFTAWLSEAYRIAKMNSCLICFCRWDVQDAFRREIEASGWQVKSQVIWDREIHGLGDLNGQFAPQHDVIWFAVKGKYKFPNNRPKSVLRFARLSGDELLHSNQKPLGLMQYLVRVLTSPNDVILDCFMGSGTTGVAAMIENRHFIGIELDNHYYNVAEARIKRACGQSAEIPQRSTDKVLPLFSL